MNSKGLSDAAKKILRYSGVDPVIGDPPCKRCDGTGNELFSMYRRCSDCGGSGVQR